MYSREYYTDGTPVGWYQSNNETVLKFEYEDEPHIIYVIKTRIKDTYLVIFENSERIESTRMELMSGKEIYNKFDLKMHYYFKHLKTK